MLDSLNTNLPKTKNVWLNSAILLQSYGKLHILRLYDVTITSNGSDIREALAACDALPPDIGADVQHIMISAGSSYSLVTLNSDGVLFAFDELATTTTVNAIKIYGCLIWSN